MGWEGRGGEDGKEEDGRGEPVLSVCCPPPWLRMLDPPLVRWQILCRLLLQITSECDSERIIKIDQSLHAAMGQIERKNY